MNNYDDFQGTRPVAEAHRFDVAALEHYLRSHVQGFQGPVEVEQFKGGQSNPTFLLRGGEKRYVLRRKPPGKLLPSAHAVDREYRVITALADSDVPVGRTYCLCTDESVIGDRKSTRLNSSHTVISYAVFCLKKKKKKGYKLSRVSQRHLAERCSTDHWSNKLRSIGCGSKSDVVA